MKLYNTLSRQVEEFTPLSKDEVTIYSCGPTVYDRVHIGNLSAFITADLLRRTLNSVGYKTKHVMNFTDVDDKTINRSQKLYPDENPQAALHNLTEDCIESFLNDNHKIGNDNSAFNFIRATDPQSIEAMQQIIRDLHQQGFAYIADDGVYFDIAHYKDSGQKYGQLIDISEQSLSSERIQNDEYAKESIHDFALWKTQKDNEPAWDFIIDGRDLTGRPGWHIECSAMSRLAIGQPFDIHTGGIDLIFPHHENEIAQSTATSTDSTYARYFVHNQHILIDGKKMSKSLNNFFTLDDLENRSIDPLAFRLLVLQSHYRKPTNFTFDNIQAAKNRLMRWRSIAERRWQTHDTLEDDSLKDDRYDVNGIILAASHAAKESLSDDLNSPEALARLDQAFDAIESSPLERLQSSALQQLFQWIDETLGLQLIESTPDVNDEQKRLLVERQRAREEHNWTESDRLRDELKQQGIDILDSASSSIWRRS